MGVSYQPARVRLRSAADVHTRPHTERREAGLPIRSSARALAGARQEALEDIDPGWCPAWDAGWQRRFRLSQAHVEDLGRWAQACRLDWDTLMPETSSALPPPKRTSVP